MANRDMHGEVGFLVGSATYWIVMRMWNKEPKVGKAIGYGVAGAFAAMLPDWMEPPTSPNHRGPLHSAASASVAAYYAGKLVSDPMLNEESKAAITAISTAFLSHHLLDHITPKGIPLF